MSFMIAYFIVAVSCIIITSRTLTAYTDYSGWVQVLVYVFFILAWTMPVAIWRLQNRHLISAEMYKYLSYLGYFMLGFAFILLALIILRDVLWTLLYWLSGKSIISPLNHAALRTANLVTVIVTFVLCLYSVYSAHKIPQILHYKYEDVRIKKPLKILMAADFHINQTIPAERVKKIVEYINAQKADVIVLPGDITDDSITSTKKQLSELKKLKAPLGIYYVLGNHETYYNPYMWEAEFAGLGWQVLHNSGVSLDSTGVYIAGVPYVGAFPVNINQAVNQAKPDEYRLLLSHIPSTVNIIKPNQIDLQVSGHTHGGQIFPFNYLAKLGNQGYVAGEYLSENTKLLITRGVGYWGPPMRLGAPSDIMIIELVPMANKNS